MVLLVGLIGDLQLGATGEQLIDDWLKILNCWTLFILLDLVEMINCQHISAGLEVFSDEQQCPPAVKLHSQSHSGCHYRKAETAADVAAEEMQADV